MLAHATWQRAGGSLQAATLKKLSGEAQAVLTGFWGSERRQMLCTALIENFLPLTVSFILTPVRGDPYNAHSFTNIILCLL